MLYKCFVFTGLYLLEIAVDIVAYISDYIH